ncbi:MAG: glycosyltransferase, partial [Deltaproteobacteria bacterium]|nr:glycosyltransferase [Deltaproteobacteria bacterium]
MSEVGGKNAPVVSIATPSYNQGRFIEETIKSVISQEGDFYIEYIVMDGASTDGSVEIIKKYGSLLESGEWPAKCLGIDYKWKSERDNGQADAIKKSFDMATGEVFAWLNSDDVYLPGAVKKALERLCEDPDLGMVYGKGYNVDEAGDILEECPTRGFDIEGLAAFNFITQPSVFFRKEAYLAAGGMDASLHYSLDLDLWVRIGRRYSVEYIEEFLSGARLHTGAKTVSKEHTLRCHEELLRTVARLYGRAPVNHVIGYCYELVRGSTPAFLIRSRVAMPLVAAVALFISLFYYLWLNKGIRLADLKMINAANIKGLLFG